MTAFVAWILFPVVLGLLSLGYGVLFEFLIGGAAPAGPMMPVGLAVVVIVAEMVTKSSSLANLETPLIVVLAIAGDPPATVA